MIELNMGRINGGQYLDEQLTINDINLGPLDVQKYDADNTLCNAISAISEINASLDEHKNLIITSDSTILIGGTRPLGRGGHVVEQLPPGLYEQNWP